MALYPGESKVHTSGHSIAEIDWEMEIEQGNYKSSTADFDARGFVYDLNRRVDRDEMEQVN